MCTKYIVSNKHNEQRTSGVLIMETAVTKVYTINYTVLTLKTVIKDVKRRYRVAPKKYSVLNKLNIICLHHWKTSDAGNHQHVLPGAHLNGSFAIVIQLQPCGNRNQSFTVSVRTNVLWNQFQDNTETFSGGSFSFYAI